MPEKGLDQPTKLQISAQGHYPRGLKAWSADGPGGDPAKEETKTLQRSTTKPRTEAHRPSRPHRSPTPEHHGK